jgi:hypothetical protein
MPGSLAYRFWSWYERHYRLNLSIAVGLFLLQLLHLTWLTLHVVWFRLFGQSLWNPEGFGRTLLIMVDYTEIPALLSTSLVYINDLRRGFRWKPLLFLAFLNSQWLHLFWITDEFVVAQFVRGGEGTVLPPWLAWIAILIDYLELPVIFDSARKLIASFARGTTKEFFRRHLRNHLWKL